MKFVVEVTERECEVLLGLVDLGFRQTGTTKIRDLTQIYNVLQNAKLDKKVTMPSGPVKRVPEENTSNNGSTKEIE